MRIRSGIKVGTFDKVYSPRRFSHTPLTCYTSGIQEYLKVHSSNGAVRTPCNAYQSQDTRALRLKSLRCFMIRIEATTNSWTGVGSQDCLNWHVNLSQSRVSPTINTYCNSINGRKV